MLAATVLVILVVVAALAVNAPARAALAVDPIRTLPSG